MARTNWIRNEIAMLERMGLSKPTQYKRVSDYYALVYSARCTIAGKTADCVIRITKDGHNASIQLIPVIAGTVLTPHDVYYRDPKQPAIYESGRRLHAAGRGPGQESVWRSMDKLMEFVFGFTGVKA